MSSVADAEIAVIKDGDKYRPVTGEEVGEAIVVSGGKIFVDSTLIGRKVERTDVDVFYVPASGLANEKNLRTLANMIITGKVIKEIPEIGTDNLEAALNKVISARHQDLFGYNLEALNLGAEQ